MLLLQLLFCTQSLLVVLLNEFLLLHFVLDLWLFVDVVCQPCSFFVMKFGLSLDNFQNIELKAFGQHLVEHSHLDDVGVEIERFVLTLINVFVIIFIIFVVGINAHILLGC